MRFMEQAFHFAVSPLQLSSCKISHTGHFDCTSRWLQGQATYQAWRHCWAICVCCTGLTLCWHCIRLNLPCSLVLCRPAALHCWIHTLLRLCYWQPTFVSLSACKWLSTPTPLPSYRSYQTALWQNGVWTLGLIECWGKRSKVIKSAVHVPCCPSFR